MSLTIPQKMPKSGGNCQRQPEFGHSGGKCTKGGGDEFQREGLSFSRTSHSALRLRHSMWGHKHSSTHSRRGVARQKHTKWASIEVCATTLHFILDRTEGLLGPRDATSVQGRKAADGGRKSTRSVTESEWTKQSQNGIMSEREQPTHQLE